MTSDAAAILMTVADASGTIHSRLKLQKMFYILRSLGYPISKRFKYKDYGPYSHELASEVETFVRLGYLDETRVEEVASGEEDDSYTRYDIRIDERGEEFLKNAAEASEGLNLDRIRLVARELNSYRPEDLELIATLMYVEDMRINEEPKEFLRRMKPKFSDRDIDRGLVLVSKFRNELAAAR